MSSGKGQKPAGRRPGYWEIPRLSRRHERLARLIRSMPDDEPTGTWQMTVAILGPRAYEVPVKAARHLAERMIVSAERHGFIRRLPVRSRSRSPSVLVWAPLKENQYVATLKGRMFVMRHEAYARLTGVLRTPRPARRSPSFKENERARMKKFKNRAPRLGDHTEG